MNHVVLTGRLTRDPESRKLASGKTVTEFSVATNDYRGGSEKAEYHPVVTWDRLAEICGQYLGKGQLVAIEGRHPDAPVGGRQQAAPLEDGDRRQLGRDVVRQAQEGLRSRVGSGGATGTGRGDGRRPRDARVLER